MGAANIKGLNEKEVKELSERTRYTIDELKNLFYEGGFVGKKKGKQFLKREEAAKVLKKFFKLEKEDKATESILHRIFDVFDKDKSGTIEFDELALGMSMLSKGTEDEKLSLLFRIMDNDGNGEIDRSELTKIVNTIYNNKATQLIFGLNIEEDEMTVEQFVDKFMEEADIDKSGTISLQEYHRMVRRIRLSVSRSFSELPEEHQEANQGNVSKDTTTPKAELLLNIVVAGPPESGKNAICKKIAEKYGLSHISMGSLLKEEIEKNRSNELERKRLQQYLHDGELVPDDIITKILESYINQPHIATKGWVLEGFPRTLKQSNFMNQAGIIPDALILLDLDDKTVIDRKTNRRYDPISGKIYHLKTSLPTKDTITPNDNLEDVLSRLKIRDSDQPDKVKEKLKNYRENIKSVLTIYGDSIHQIDASQSLDKVIDDVSKVIESLPDYKKWYNKLQSLK